METAFSKGEHILIEAEKLSLLDTFMRYNPKTGNEISTKELISQAICKETKNFYRPKFDPSFTDDGEGVCFELSRKPAVGRSYNWWSSAAQRCGGRLGTELEYGAFLGVLLKRLVELDCKSVELAWHLVCNDSRILGHYLNSKNSSKKFELTGSRFACGFYDLANTHKLLASDNKVGFLMAGGCCYSDSYNFPLATLVHCYSYDYTYYNSVGWVVFS